MGDLSDLAFSKRKLLRDIVRGEEFPAFEESSSLLGPAEDVVNRVGQAITSGNSGLIKAYAPPFPVETSKKM